MVMEEQEKKKRVESLGWLTESSVMPKKHKAIEGVGASSILELRAQLYKTQEEAKKAKDLAPDIEFHRAKKKIGRLDVFSQKNSGVENRANRDKLELKAINDGSVSYAALERKAELYDKLSRGQLPDEEEKYCVDFFQKSLGQEGSEQPEGCEPSAVTLSGNENEGTDADLLHAKPVGPGRTGNTVDNDEHKRFVREVHEETDKAREKATTLKLRRQEQAVTHREKLRKAYLLKQLEKLIAEKKAQQT